MNIEIDEKVIQEHLALEVNTIVTRVVKRITDSYNFEQEIAKMVRASMLATVESIIAEQDIEEVRSMVKVAMVKSIKSKLERAIKLHDGA